MTITNTLENPKKLEALGAPAPLARGIAEIVEEAIQANNQDLKTFFREEMERQFSAFRAEVKAEFAAVRGEISDVRVELKAEIVTVRGELKAEIAAVRGEISDVRGDLKTGLALIRAELQREMRQLPPWFFTMAAGIATISVAIIKLFPNAPYRPLPSAPRFPWPSRKP